MYHYSLKIIKRSAGRSSTAAAAYRAGLDIVDERTGEHHKYGNRKGVLDHTILAPSRTPENLKEASGLWNEIERVEDRVNSQVARENVVALHHKLTVEQNREMVHGFVQEAYVKRGMIAQVDIHAPGEDGDQRNIHAHIMLTMRGVTRNGFKEKKARNWNERKTLLEWRELWADHMNRTLEKAGHSEQVTHKSFKDLGLDKIPSNHLGLAATQIQRRHEKDPKENKNSRIVEENEQVKKRNQKLEDLKFQNNVIDLAVKKEERRILEEAKITAANAEREKKARFNQDKRAQQETWHREDHEAAQDNKNELEAIRLADEKAGNLAYQNARQELKDFYHLDSQENAYEAVLQRVKEKDRFFNRATGAHAKEVKRAEEMRASIDNGRYRQEEALRNLDIKFGYVPDQPPPVMPEIEREAAPPDNIETERNHPYGKYENNKRTGEIAREYIELAQDPMHDLQRWLDETDEEVEEHSHLFTRPEKGAALDHELLPLRSERERDTAAGIEAEKELGRQRRHDKKVIDLEWETKPQKSGAGYQSFSDGLDKDRAQEASRQQYREEMDRKFAAHNERVEREQQAAAVEKAAPPVQQDFNHANDNAPKPEKDKGQDYGGLER